MIIQLESYLNILSHIIRLLPSPTSVLLVIILSSVLTRLWPLFSGRLMAPYSTSTTITRPYSQKVPWKPKISIKYGYSFVAPNMLMAVQAPHIPDAYDLKLYVYFKQWHTYFYVHCIEMLIYVLYVRDFLCFSMHKQNIIQSR